MTDRNELTKRIADVVRYHELAQLQNWETNLRCECDEDFVSKYQHAIHVAKRIVAVLREGVIID